MAERQDDEVQSGRPTSCSNLQDPASNSRTGARDAYRNIVPTAQAHGHARPRPRPRPTRILVPLQYLASNCSAPWPGCRLLVAGC